MEQRIRKMEQLLNRSAAAVTALASALENYDAIQTELQELADYYASPLWLQDLDADRAGALPADLKRGVLSEDAIYDLLEKNRRLLALMKAISTAPAP